LAWPGRRRGVQAAERWSGTGLRGLLELESAARILRDEAGDLARDLRRWREQVDEHEQAGEAWEESHRAPVP
jgi:hypothetical protein